MSTTGALIPIKSLEAIEGSQKIIASFTPKVGELNALYEEYDEIVTGYPMNGTEEEQRKSAETLADKAKALRAKMVKIRTSTQKVHDEVKAEYLPVTKAIDSVNKLIKDTSQEAEEKLQFIVDTEKRIEENRILKLEVERTAALAEYSDGAPLPGNLGTMDDQTWDAILAGWKAKHEQKLRDEAAEKERQKKEKLGTDRKLKAAPFSDYIPGFVALDFSCITEEEFTGILDTAKEAKKTADAEVQAIKEKAAEAEVRVPMEAVSGTSEKSAPGDPYLTEIKEYLFKKMMNCPSPKTSEKIRRALEVLG